MTGLELLLTAMGGLFGAILYITLGWASYKVVDALTHGYVSGIFRTSPEYVMRAADHNDPAAGPLFACFVVWPIGAPIALAAAKLAQFLDARQ